jgi:hypothetical protein
LCELAGVELAAAGDEAGLWIAVGLQQLVCERGGGLEEIAVEVGEVVQEDAGVCGCVGAGLGCEELRSARRRIDAVYAEGHDGRPVEFQDVVLGRVGGHVTHEGDADVGEAAGCCPVACMGGQKGLKQWRGIATRYEKTATIYLAGLHIAGIFLWSVC